MPVSLHSYLVYSGALDPRLCEILAGLGAAVRPVSNIQAFLRSVPADCERAVLVDVARRHDDGVAVVAQPAAHFQHAVIVPICADGSVDFCRKCFTAGAADVLDKSFDDTAIADALRVHLAACRESASQPRRGNRARFASLTAREREIFQHLTEGKSSREIGQILSLSPRTVECHRAHLGAKLDTRNLAQMARRYGPFLDEL